MIIVVVVVAVIVIINIVPNVKISNKSGIVYNSGVTTVIVGPTYAQTLLLVLSL